MSLYFVTQNVYVLQSKLLNEKLGDNFNFEFSLHHLIGTFGDLGFGIIDNLDNAYGSVVSRMATLLY